MLPKPPREEEDEEEVVVVVPEWLLPVLPAQKLVRVEEELRLLAARLQISSASGRCVRRACSHSSRRVGSAQSAAEKAPPPSSSRVMAMGRRTGRA